jgi:hypothetical protein
MYGHYLDITVVIFIIIALLLALFFYDRYKNNHHPKPVSQAQTHSVAGAQKTFRSAYFQFQDSGNWVLNAKESTDNKYIYYKYHGLIVEHQLIVYVNQVPISLYLAVSRSLPVRIVNNNGFDVTNVSEPCGRTYGPTDQHKIKEVSLNQTTLLCDPDTPQYSVVLSEIGGDYKLRLQRLDGAQVQFIITYHNLTLDPSQDTIKNVASSFQAL